VPVASLMLVTGAGVDGDRPRRDACASYCREIGECVKQACSSAVPLAALEVPARLFFGSSPVQCECVASPAGQPVKNVCATHSPRSRHNLVTTGFVRSVSRTEQL
jgi:hypothetical protein